MIVMGISSKQKLLVLGVFIISYFFSSCLKASSCKFFVNSDIYLAEISSNLTSEVTEQDILDLLSFVFAEVSHSVKSLFTSIFTVHYVLFHSELPFIYSDLPPPGFHS